MACYQKMEKEARVYSRIYVLHYIDTCDTCDTCDTALSFELLHESTSKMTNTFGKPRAGEGGAARHACSAYDQRAAYVHWLVSSSARPQERCRNSPRYCCRFIDAVIHFLYYFSDGPPVYTSLTRSSKQHIPHVHQPSAPTTDIVTHKTDRRPSSPALGKSSEADTHSRQGYV